MINWRRQLVFSGVGIAVGLLLGRLAGFLRELGVVSTFGVTAEADVVILALTIPDVLVSLLMAGGLSAALIPEFKTLSERQSNTLFWQSTLVFGLLFVFLVLVLQFFLSELVQIFGPGLAPDVSLRTQILVSDILWLMPLTVVAGVSTAFLQSKERFLIPAMGTFIFNMALVIGLWFFVDSPGNIADLLLFVIIGGFARWFSQLWFLSDGSVLLTIEKRLYLGRRLFRRYIQAVFAIGLISLLPVIARSFSSYSGEGGIAIINYAWKLIELPLGLAVSVVSIVLFPKLSSLAVEAKETEFNSLFRDGVSWSLLLAGVAMVPLMIAPQLFVSFVYGWADKMDAHSLQEISELARYAALVLPTQAFIFMAMAALNARGETQINMRISLLGIVLLVCLSAWTGNQFGLVGVILAVVVVLFVIDVVFIVVLSLHGRGLGLDVLRDFFVGGAISGFLTELVLLSGFGATPRFFLLLLAMPLSIAIIVISRKSYRAQFCSLMLSR